MRRREASEHGFGAKRHLDWADFWGKVEAGTTRSRFGMAAPFPA